MTTVAKYQILFWLSLIGTVFLSLMPVVGGEQLFELQDKVGHSSIYAALFFLCASAYGRRYPLALLALILAAFGLSMEIAQSMTSYRQGDHWDMLANLSGILAVWAVMAWRRKQHD
jgi:VanZ family protein|tara:strand:+ start:569 stop:916 length:348 start_codon:yes stop_codon:yes gene_type:complete